MGELLDAAVSPANLVLTVLAVFILVYWITVIIGVVDIDVFDIELDFDADAEVDGVAVTWLNSALAFFNLGQVPIMVFLTFLIIPAWALSLIVNDFFGNSSFLFGTITLAGVLFISLFIAKILTMPFVKVFGKLGKEGQEDEVLIGKICTVTISARFDKTGQALVETNGAPHILNIRTPKGVEMQKKDQGLVLEYLKDKNVYLIEPFNQ